MTTRRDIMAAGFGATLITTVGGTLQAQTGQKTFVLVHGAWGGGVGLAARRGFAGKARTQGLHADHERGRSDSHLLDAKMNLSTHITDIVNVIKWERIENAVLVGHSYGGMVITGVAEQIEPAIASIVFLDAFLPDNNRSLADIAPQLARTAVEKHDLTIAAPPAEFFAVNEKDRVWVDTLSTPHPTATMTEKVKETGARERIARKAHVLATGRRSPIFSAAYAKIQSAAGWRSYEVPCGHFVMIDMPDRLVEILLEA